MKPSENPINSDAQSLLNQIVIDYMKEKRFKRIWRWVKSILFILLAIALYFLVRNWMSEEAESLISTPHIGRIDLSGTISDSEMNADSFSKSMKAAYKNPGLSALIIRINSPGGSPVQADYMFNTLQHYRQKYPKVKIYAVCVDFCASAAYYVAAGADYIYANEASLVGSIGVLYNGFGFVDGLNKLGITRRLITAGANKGFLDPFSPIDVNQERLMKGMLNTIHLQFIKRVKEGRGARLKIDNLTFSGLFWTGTDAKDRGLIDGFAGSDELARQVIKLNKLVDYTYKKSLFEQMSKQIGAAVISSLPRAMGLESGVQA